MLSRIANRVPSRAFAVLCVAAAAGTAYSQQTIQLPGDFASLQDALNPAVSGLAPGDTIVLSDAVAYLGTFSVTTPDITIRAAAGQSPVLDANGPGTVVTVNIGSGGLTLEGLTIQDGTNQGTGQRGSGIDIDNAGLVTIRDCTIRNNTSDNGGGLFTNNTDLLIEDTLFLNNTAPTGGGMFVGGTSNVTLRGTTFSNNTATTGFGGGLDFDVSSSSSIVIEDALFDGNSCGSRGGGARIENPGSATITGSVFTGNTSTLSNNTDGGGLYLFGPTDTTIRGCDFELNVANGLGGAIDARLGTSDTLRVVGTRFVENASSRGGAVHALGGTSDFVSTTFTRNNADQDGEGPNAGGAVTLGQFNDDNRGNARFFNSVFEGNSASGAGAIELGHRCTAAVLNSTFVGNTAETGSAVEATATGVNVEIFNSVFAGNVPSLDQVNIRTANGVENASFNLFDAEGLIGDGADNLFNTNPLFADQIGGDFTLLAGSPAIDAGNSDLYVGGPMSDIVGNPRGQDDPQTADTGVALSGAVVDMGAFEFNVAGGNADCPADIAAPEGVLDLSDISTFIQAFQAGCP